jgi:glyoxylase-like metal-dependent hydrolase (beta-lactamase superfamily II)
MDELDSGLWHWTARHPGWEEGEPWDPDVSSYAMDDGERLLLFDPLGVPDEIEALARERETAIVLTAPWHERDSHDLVQRLGVPVYTPAPDTTEDLMRDWNLTAEQVGDGSPDVRWLRQGEGEAHWYEAGDQLPFGIGVFPGHKRNDLVLWIEDRRAVVAGDTIADLGEGLQINERWLRKDVTRESVAEGLRPLLELPVVHLLPTHGAPANRAALERVLS